MRGWIDFYGRTRTGPALNFHALQLTAFGFAAWLFLSWDFSTLGFLPDDAFTRPTRMLLYGVWKTPWYYYTSFQFIYEWLPRPGVATLAMLQVVTAVAAVMGAIGVLPKFMAFVVFLVGTHLVGMFLPGSATMDGSASALMYLVLLLCVAPRACFYRIGASWRPFEMHERYHWPQFLLVVFLCGYYFVAALNKMIDVVIDWPHILAIDAFSAVAIEKALFSTSWDTSLWFSHLLTNPYLAALVAWAVLLVELFCPVVLFIPRLIPAFLLPLAGMHIGIYLSHGYGYFVNAAADLLATFGWLTNARMVGTGVSRAAHSSRPIRPPGSPSASPS